MEPTNMVRIRAWNKLGSAWYSLIVQGPIEASSTCVQITPLNSPRRCCIAWASNLPVFCSRHSHRCQVTAYILLGQATCYKGHSHGVACTLYDTFSRCTRLDSARCSTHNLLFDVGLGEVIAMRHGNTQTQHSVNTHWTTIPCIINDCCSQLVLLFHQPVAGVLLYS